MANSTAILGQMGLDGDSGRALMIFSDYFRYHHGYLDARRYREIPYHDGTLASHAERGEERTARSGTWLKRWKYCPGRGILSFRTSSS